MIRIITDTTACLSEFVVKHYGISIVPQIIHFGEETYYEGIDIDVATFMNKLRSAKNLPKTSAPSPELFTSLFSKLGVNNDPILCIHPSSEVSGTVRSAMVAKNDFADREIHVIDTRTIASPLGTMVKLAAQWAEEGYDATTIVMRLQEMSQRCHIYFLVATLEYLAKGGRIGGAAALLGSVLQIKPILTLTDGKVEQYERERTHKRAINRLVEIAKEQIPQHDRAFLTVLHADAQEDALMLADQLRDIQPEDEIEIFDMPPAIVTHAGPGLLGIGFFSNPDNL